MPLISHLPNPNAPFPLTDETLNRDYAELAAMHAEAKATDAEAWRLTRLLRPDMAERSSIFHTYLEPDKMGAWIGPVPDELLVPQARSAAVNDDGAEAKRRADDAERVAKGLPLEMQPDTQSLINHCQRKRAALEVAIEKKENKIRAEKTRLGGEMMKKLKPAEVVIAKRFFRALTELHEVTSEIMKTRRDLQDSEIGYFGVYSVPTNCELMRDIAHSNDMAKLFAAGKEAGYCDIPKGLR
jgi:hypothetical protein